MSPGVTTCHVNISWVPLPPQGKESLLTLQPDNYSHCFQPDGYSSENSISQLYRACSFLLPCPSPTPLVPGLKWREILSQTYHWIELCTWPNLDAKKAGIWGPPVTRRETKVANKHIALSPRWPWSLAHFSILESQGYSSMATSQPPHSIFTPLNLQSDFQEQDLREPVQCLRHSLRFAKRMGFPWGIWEEVDECWGRREETGVVSLKKREWCWSRHVNRMQESTSKTSYQYPLESQTTTNGGSRKS